MPGEGFAQITPDSTGAKIRTLEEEDVLQSDGLTREDVETQVMALADENGNLIKEGFQVRAPRVESLLIQLIAEQKRTNELLMQLLS